MPQAVEKRLLDVWVANSIRMFRARASHLIIDDAGWHMSFFADAEGVAKKLKACAHDHWRNAGLAGDTERIDRGMQEGEDMFYGGALLLSSTHLNFTQCHAPHILIYCSNLWTLTARNPGRFPERLATVWEAHQA